MFSTIVLALVASSASVMAAPGLSVALSGVKDVSDVDNFSVVATVTNTGDETLNLLNDPTSLHTPNWKTQMFDIANAEGLAPRFKGVKVKYAPKIAVKNKAYTTIAPGQSLEFTHVLGGVYNFTGTGASAYTITPSSQAQLFTHVTESGELTTIVADVAEAHSAQLSGKLTPTAYLGARSSAALGKRNSFNGCSSSRQSTLTTAAKNAQTYASNAASYLSANTASTTRYVTWFGTYTSSRHSTVLTHYNDIANGQLSTDTFDCTCTESDTYAYTYPDQFGEIYLCSPVYWEAPATGTDSQAGTLIHESSHFTKNGGTQDYVYGQSGAKSLAKSNPGEAVENADNHEYFAENNPAQS